MRQGQRELHGAGRGRGGSGGAQRVGGSVYAALHSAGAAPWTSPIAAHSMRHVSSPPSPSGKLILNYNKAGQGIAPLLCFHLCTSSQPAAAAARLCIRCLQALRRRFWATTLPAPTVPCCHAQALHCRNLTFASAAACRCAHCLQASQQHSSATTWQAWASARCSPLPRPSATATWQSAAGSPTRTSGERRDLQLKRE